MTRLGRALLGRLRDAGARSVERRLDPMSPAERLAFFNLGVTRVDPIAVVSCSHVTRGQLKALASRRRRVSRSLVRLRFGARWVSLVDLDVMGSTYAEIVMTALNGAGARVVLHPSVCHALNPELKPGDVCLLAEADADEDPVCRAYGVNGVVRADPGLLDALDRRLGGIAPGHGIRVHRSRSCTVPVFVNLDGEELARMAGKGDLFDLEVATIYALAERFGMRALSVKMVAGCRTDETDVFRAHPVRIEQMLRKGEHVLRCVAHFLARIDPAIPGWYPAGEEPVRR